MILDTVRGWFDALNYYVLGRRPLPILDEYENHVVRKTPLVRDGVALLYVEMDSGIVWIQAARRTRPYLRATFLVEDKVVADAWRDEGIVPDGEIADLYRRFQAGTWPDEPISGSG